MPGIYDSAEGLHAFKATVTVDYISTVRRLAGQIYNGLFSC